MSSMVTEYLDRPDFASRFSATAGRLRLSIEVETYFFPLQRPPEYGTFDDGYEFVAVTDAELEGYASAFVPRVERAWNQKLWLLPVEAGTSSQCGDPIECELRVVRQSFEVWNQSHWILAVVKAQKGFLRGHYRGYAWPRGLQAEQGRDLRGDPLRKPDACLDIRSVEEPQIGGYAAGEPLHQLRAAHEIGHHLGLQHPLHVSYPDDCDAACSLEWQNQRDSYSYGPEYSTRAEYSLAEWGAVHELMGRGMEVTPRLAQPWIERARSHGLEALSPDANAVDFVASTRPHS